VVVPIMNPIIPMSKGTEMCKNFSPVLSALLLTKYEQIQEKTHGGAPKSKVSVVLYPKVAVIVGKNWLKDI
jgi:hypothetical protein